MLDQAIRPNEKIADLILRVAMNDGSFDNIIDHSSCISLELPYTVIVNDTELTINDKEDFYMVEHIIDKSEDDEDVIEINYPVTAIQADHSELILNNEDDLEALVDQCPENTPDDDIECIDFKYPITLYIFDSQNQIPDVISVENDRDLYDFFKEFEDDELVSFDYPFYLRDLSKIDYVRDLSGIGYVRVDSKLELENYISAAEGVCDEDDDNDYNDDDADVTYLKAVLMFGEWEIAIGSGFSFDTTFPGYKFNFIEHGLVEVSTEDGNFSGFWYANGDYGVPELELDFGGESPLDQLEEDWEVSINAWHDVSASTIYFNTEDEITYLMLSRPSNDYLISDFPNILDEGAWVVTSYTKSGKDETGNYNGFLFDFEEKGSTFDQTSDLNVVNGNVVATKDDEAVGGTFRYTCDFWTGIVEEFILDFGESTILNAFNNNWEIVGVKEERVKLFYFNEEDGTYEGLTFEWTHN